MNRAEKAHKLRVVLTGGGTGGHVYPALAIYQLLREAELVDEALYLGVRGRAEETIVPKSGLELRFVPSAPFAGSSILAKLGALLVVLRGALVSAWHLLRFRPRLVVAAGGYVAAPVILAAFLLKPWLRLRIIVDEQNFVPGLLNKFASLFADVILLTFKETAYFLWSHRCVPSGYPVRRPYLEKPPSKTEAKRALGLDPESCLVVVAGGSMGARSINRAIARALPGLAKLEGVQIVHSVGLREDKEYDALEDTVAELRRSVGDAFDTERYELRDGERVVYRAYRYLDDLVAYQQAADLVVSRSGAGSLSEILALGKASILVPKRGLPGDHQEMNAIAVAEQGGAEVLFERRQNGGGADQLSETELVELVTALAADPARRSELESGAAALFDHQVEARILRTARRLVEDREVEYLAQIVEPRTVRFQRSFDSLVNFLDRTDPASSVGALYHRFYRIKAEESLEGSAFLTVNRGIKLVGALRLREHYPFLREHFPRFRGYLKRNALSALCKAAEPEPWFPELVLAGLRDRYYETRREAIALYRRFPEAMRGQEAIEARILELMRRRHESWEVRTEAIRAAMLFLSQEEFLAAMRRFRAHRNIRAREALLEAIEQGLREERFGDLRQIRLFLKRMLVTTSEFTPHFKVRGRYVRVVEQLERTR